MSHKYNLVLGNPPYLKRGWKKFLEGMISRSKEYVISINPDPTSNLTPFGLQVKNLLLEAGVQESAECTSKFKVDSGKISYFICHKGQNGNKKLFLNSSVPDQIKEKVISTVGNYKSSFFMRGGQASIHSEKSPIKTNIFNKKCLFSVLNSGEDVQYMKDCDCPSPKKHKDTLKGRMFAVNRFFGKNNPDPVVEISKIENYFIGYNVIVFKPYQGETIDGFRSVYCSKLYRFVIKIMRNGSYDITQGNLMLLPRLDLSKTWTDKEIYDEFGLTKEERLHIDPEYKD